MLGATNRPNIVDPALLRPGRFDLQLEIPLPDLAGRKEIFAIGLRGKPMCDAVSIETLAGRTDGFNGAEIQSICTRAAWSAIREALEDGELKNGLPGVTITPRHLEQAFEELRGGSPS